MKISIGNDHSGITQKNAITEYLKQFFPHTIITNHGTNSTDPIDYPDVAHKVAQDVNDGTSNLGILLCGTANGVAITANRYPNVRAAIAYNTEVAQLIKEHNNANVICFPARFLTPNQITSGLHAFLTATFQPRHQQRINKINDLQQPKTVDGLILMPGVSCFLSDTQLTGVVEAVSLDQVSVKDEQGAVRSPLNWKSTLYSSKLAFQQINGAK